MKGTEYLTGLRGFAVLIVLLGHISNTGAHVIPGLDLHATAKAGVWLFFVLSAYLLTEKLVSDLTWHRRGAALWRYSVRRVFRIMPTYLAFLAGLVALSEMNLGTALQHGVLARGEGHLWTIPVEMKFYVLLPFIAIALILVEGRWRTPLACAFVALSLIVYYAAGASNISNNSVSLLNYLPFFAVGVLLATTGLRGGSLIGWGGILSIVFLSPRFIGALTGMSIEQALAWSWLFAVAWGAVMSGAAHGLLNKCFSLRPLIFLGEISFSLYLVHYVVIAQIRAMADVNAITGIVMVIFSIVIAYLVYRFVEVPTRDLGYRLTPYERSVAGSRR